ncbi:MAG: aminotransferase class I/II-fold pyridoxal phosphate-dependent enzyme [Burkholderiaceae bacterium]|nr:aminotransferase class I/II-fold pyridoxal phosphate-dependent enzyme [Burkholderiaceae bacterium]
MSAAVMYPMATRMAAIKPSPSMAAKIRVDQLRAEGHDIVDFTVGEPDMDTPTHIGQAGINAIQEGQTRYTGSAGTRPLLQAIQQKFLGENQLRYELDQLVVGTGAKQLIFTALAATVNAGDEVIIPAPYWVSYPDMVMLNDGKPVIVTCTEEQGFKLTPEALEQAITPRTKWLLLNTPSNPTGAMYSRDELQALIAVLHRHPQVWVLTDEIYEHIAYGTTPFVSMAALDADILARTLTVNGVSKAYAMTGWRLGYAGGPKALVKAIVTLISQSTSCVSAISQAAATTALTADQRCVTDASAVFKSRRDVIVAQLNAIDGLHCPTPDGAFYVFPSVHGLIGKTTPQGATLETDLDVTLYLLNEAKVALMDGSSYGLPGYLRMSFATSLDQIQEGCRRIAQACAALN